MKQAVKIQKAIELSNTCIDAIRISDGQATGADVIFAGLVLAAYAAQLSGVKTDDLHIALNEALQLLRETGIENMELLH